MQNICPNCGKEIENNFERHKLFCERNITRCPKCSEPVRKSVCAWKIILERISSV